MIFYLSETASAQNVNIGTITEFHNNLKPSTATARVSKDRTVKHDKGSFIVTVNHSLNQNGADFILGEIKGSSNSNVSFNISNNSLEGLAVMPKEKKAYRYSSDAAGNVYVREVDINAELCIEYATSDESSMLIAENSVPEGSSSVYTLQSLPGATAVAYLDFDGEYVTGTAWNGGNPINALPGNFTEANIKSIWQLVSEDYRPFNINITTDPAVFKAAPANRRMRCIFTPTRDASATGGGIAYINSFSRSTDNDAPCWVFNTGIKSSAEAASHELGHTFGLHHDGRTNPVEGYYHGHDIWAPIMGTSYYKGLSQWSIGEYPYANNFQDDLAIIANTTNGFGYRTDEAGNTIALAKPLVVGSTGTVSGIQNYGIITTRTDLDVYKFTTSGGLVTLNVSPSPTWPDLDIALKLSNSSGTVLASSNPTAIAPGSQTGPTAITGLNASVSLTLPAGTYFLTVDGTGKGDLATGYSDYASLGEYTISGTLPVNKAPVVSISSPATGTNYTAPAAFTMNATATDSDGSITKVEFYKGTVLIGIDVTAPYSFAVSGLTAGKYDFKVVATDNSGATASSSVSVNVTDIVANKAPVATITSPVSGTSYLAPATITINATASDIDGIVSKVTFYNGSVILGTDLTAPYSFTLNATTAGSYAIKAVATDNAGATGSSAVVTINVAEVVANKAPVATITSPTSGTSYLAPATITISATASDVDGTVSKVTFYNGSVVLGTDLTAPYSFVLNATTAGTYAIKAVATDNSGATGSSSVVNVLVTAPTTTIGISNISCTNPGVATTFTLTGPDGYTSSSWWANGEATIVVDPADSKKVKITFTQNSLGNITVTCGVNLSVSPWYKEYTTTIQVGNCPSSSVARTVDIMTAPHPFDGETSVSLSSGENIISMRIFDMNGKEFLYTENVNQDNVLVGKDLVAGIYIVQIVTETGTYTRRIVKTH